MAGVTFKVPGIGDVEAKNAATEQTLKEILKVMKGVEENTEEATGEGGNKLSNAFKAVSGRMMFLAAQAKFVSNGFKDLNNVITGTIKDFADVGDSVENAAKMIPILAPLFTMVAGASTKLNNAFLESAKSGASFGGSVNAFAKSAAESGMTLEKFGAFLSKNGEGLLAFGTTTEEGAKRFTQVSKSLRAASGDLYALGFTTEDINQGLANYGDLLRKQGLQGTKSNNELAAGAKNYLKEIDALAKITGEERSVKEAQMKALATDAQFQMAFAGKSAETRESFMKLVGGFGPSLGGFVKDFISTGSLTTEANQKIASALGGEVMNELNGMRQKMLNNQQLTAEEQDRLRNIIKRVGAEQSKALGTSLAASREQDDMSKALIESQQLNVDAVKNASEEQKKAAKFSDGFNKRMQEIQQRLAALSTQFTAILADSKVLDVMMGAFEIMANLTKLLVVPAFELMTGAISLIGQLASTYVAPAFEQLGNLIKEYVAPVFYAVSDFISDNLTPILAGLATYFVALNAATAYRTVLETGQNALLAVKNGLLAVSNANLFMLAGAALAASLPFIKIALPILGLVGLFKLLYDNGFTFKSALEEIVDGLLRLLNSVTLGKMGLSKQEYEDRTKAREAEREKLADDRKIDKERKERDREAARLDNKIIGDKSKYAKSIEDSNKKLDVSSNNAEQNLKNFATAEGSPLVPKDKQQATAKAEATRKEIEKKDEAAKQDETAKTADQKTSAAKTSTTQESAESLLSNLNTKMDQLIKLQAQTTTNTYQQVVATRSLSQDLYQGLPS